MLNKHNLSIANLASKEESRFTLNAIYVTPEYTVETDGHQLVMVTTPKEPERVEGEASPLPAIPNFTHDPAFKPFLLPSKDALEIVKSIPKKPFLDLLEHVFVGTRYTHKTIDGPDTKVTEHASLAVTDLESPRTFSPVIPAGTFPDYTRVVPRKENADLAIAISVNLLGPVIKQFQSFMKEERSGAAIFRFTRPRVDRSFVDSRTVRIDATNELHQTMTAVVMPMRMEESDAHAIAHAQAVGAPPTKLFKALTCARKALDEAVVWWTDNKPKRHKQDPPWFLSATAALQHDIQEPQAPPEPPPEAVPQPTTDPPAVQSHTFDVNTLTDKLLDGVIGFFSLNEECAKVVKENQDLRRIFADILTEKDTSDGPNTSD